VICYPDQLKAGDLVIGYGKIQRVNAFHVPGCPRENCDGYCDHLGRTVVRIFGDGGFFIFDSTRELEVHRPEPLPEYQASHLQDVEDRL
jgi:hypothetical protein